MVDDRHVSQEQAQQVAEHGSRLTGHPREVREHEPEATGATA